MNKRPLLLCALTAAAAVLAGCGGYAPTTVPTPTPATSAPAAPSAPVTCEDPLQSYSPDATPGPAVRRIKDRGRLIAGVSADTYLMASRNPETGQIRGFDIEFVRAIAKAIFGDPDRYQLKVITAADRLPVLGGKRNGEPEQPSVDIVVRNMTINCARWQEIAFSAEYYRAGQKFLVRSDSSAKATSRFRGVKVCAPAGTTSLENLKKRYPSAVPVTADNHTGCLVKFQQGEADAITGDDTVLAGLAAQDPYARVLDMPAFTEEPYGIGVPKDDVDLVRFINAVLRDMRRDGSWKDAYDRWLAPTLGRDATAPKPQYGRTR